MHDNTAFKIFTNTAGQIILRSIDIVFGVITLGLITRYLGQEGFGYYTTVFAFLQLFIIIIDFGLYLTLLREISSQPKERISFITSNIFTLRLLSSIIFLSIASMVVFLTPYPLAVKWGVVGMTIAFLSTSLITTLSALFQKYFQIVRIAAAIVLSKIILLALVIYIITTNAGLQTIFYANSFAVTISFFVVWYMVKKLPEPIHLKLRFNVSYIKRVISITWPLAITTALNLIYFKTDTIILSIFKDAESVGLYGAGYRVVEIISTFPHMFMGLIMPLLTAAWVAKNIDRLNIIWERTFTFFALITLPLIAGAYVVGEDLMRLIAGEEFVISGTILKILILASAAIFFGTLYTYMVLVVEQQRKMIKYFLSTAVIALIGYFYLIPRFSFWGAAWMTVTSEILIVIGAALVVRKYVRLSIPWATLSKLIVASILMAIATNYLQNYLHLLLVIAISAIIYLVLVFLFRAITIKDIQKLLDRNNGSSQSS